MSNLFQLQAPCPLFAPEDGLGTQQLISFASASRWQNSAGEIEASYLGIGTFSVDLQPTGGNYTRIVAGTVEQIDYVAFVYGNTRLRVGNRCYISGLQLEIINIQQYGQEHAELSLKEIGR